MGIWPAMRHDVLLAQALPPKRQPPAYPASAFDAAKASVQRRPDRAVRCNDLLANRLRCRDRQLPHPIRLSLIEINHLLLDR